MLRQDIISQFNEGYTGALYSPYEDMLGCFTFKGDPAYEVIKLNTWFQGCIESLFYKPNKYCLILKGEQGIGKTKFFKDISPKQNWIGFMTNMNGIQVLSRSFFMLCLDEELEYYSKVKQMRSLCQSQEFVLLDDLANHPATDKRLASYCATVKEWNHPVAKSDLVIDIESINFQLLAAIDKDLLWSELFHKYKLK